MITKMIKETLVINIGDDLITVIVRILNLDQYIKDIGGKLLSNDV